MKSRTSSKLRDKNAHGLVAALKEDSHKKHEETQKLALMILVSFCGFCVFRGNQVIGFFDPDEFDGKSNSLAREFTRVSEAYRFHQLISVLHKIHEKCENTGSMSGRNTEKEIRSYSVGNY
jgi:hypothetical protein